MSPDGESRINVKIPASKIPVIIEKGDGVFIRKQDLRQIQGIISSPPQKRDGGWDVKPNLIKDARPSSLEKTFKEELDRMKREVRKELRDLIKSEKEVLAWASKFRNGNWRQMELDRLEDFVAIIKQVEGYNSEPRRFIEVWEPRGKIIEIPIEYTDIYGDIKKDVRREREKILTKVFLEEPHESIVQSIQHVIKTHAEKMDRFLRRAIRIWEKNQNRLHDMKLEECLEFVFLNFWSYWLYVQSILDGIDIIERNINSIEGEAQKKKSTFHFQDIEHTTQKYLNLPDDMLIGTGSFSELPKSIVLEEVHNTIINLRTGFRGTSTGISTYGVEKDYYYFNSIKGLRDFLEEYGFENEWIEGLTPEIQREIAPQIQAREMKYEKLRQNIETEIDKLETEATGKLHEKYPELNITSKDIREMLMYDIPRGRIKEILETASNFNKRQAKKGSKMAEFVVENVIEQFRKFPSKAPIITREVLEIAEFESDPVDLVTEPSKEEKEQYFREHPLQEPLPESMSPDGESRINVKIPASKIPVIIENGDGVFIRKQDLRQIQGIISTFTASPQDGIDSTESKLEQFTFTPERKTLLSSALKKIEEIRERLGNYFVRAEIFGSFVTEKLSPRDIDVLIWISEQYLERAKNRESVPSLPGGSLEDRVSLTYYVDIPMYKYSSELLVEEGKKRGYGLNYCPIPICASGHDADVAVIEPAGEKIGKLALKRAFEAYYIAELEKLPPKTFELPEFLKPYENHPPTDSFDITKGKHTLRIRLYGKMLGKPFTRDQLTRENIEVVVCVHDASHSVKLFLDYKHLLKAVALHSIVPFVFSTSLPYTLYYTQKWEFPLITTELMTPVEEMLYKNLLPKTTKGPQGGRWCTRNYKIDPSRLLYTSLGLKGITQLKGITKYQSTKRNKMYQGLAIDLVSSPVLLKKIKEKTATPADYEKYFYVNQKLPIFEVTDAEIIKTIQENNLKRNPPEEIMIYKSFDWKASKVTEERVHGCIMCPFRNKMWYYFLKYQYPDLFTLCNQWRMWGSGKRIEAGGEPYYYFYNPVTQKGEKIM